MAQTVEARKVVFTPTSQKLGGIAGIAFAVLLTLDLFGSTWPLFSDPIADIRAFFVDNATSLLVIGWAEAFLMTFVLLFFAACLRDTLAWSETVPTEFPRLTFVGAIVAASLSIAALVPTMAAVMTGAVVDDGILRFVMYMDAVAYGLLFAFGFGLMAFAASVVIIRTGALARWLGWMGMASAAALVVGGLWIVSGDDTGPFAIVSYAGLTLWLLWALGVGIDMVRRTRAT